jgi:hypothetical protein
MAIFKRLPISPFLEDGNPTSGSSTAPTESVFLCEKWMLDGKVLLSLNLTQVEYCQFFLRVRMMPFLYFQGGKKNITVYQVLHGKSSRNSEVNIHYILFESITE